MNARRPNKKRNPLLMFEFLTREASRRLVEGDEPGSGRILTLLRQTFGEGTELRREYLIAKSVVNTRVSSPAVAAHALSDAREASRKLNVEKLEREKSKLIAMIDRDVDPSGAMYEAPLDDYRFLSTVGTLVHDWRSSNEDGISRVAEYEDKLMERMLAKVEPILSEPVTEHTPGERRAIIAAMVRRLEEKWGKTLTSEQRNLVRDYVLAKDPSEMLSKLNEAKSRALACIAKCASGEDVRGYFGSRLEEAKALLERRDFDKVDDEAVGLGLLYLKLVAEAEEAEDGK